MLNDLRLNCQYLAFDYLTLNTYIFLNILFLAVFFILVRNRGVCVLAGFSAVIIGGAGNILERLLKNGCVLDYLNFFDLVYFNLYDLLIMGGLLTVIVKGLILDRVKKYDTKPTNSFS